MVPVSEKRLTGSHHQLLPSLYHSSSAPVKKKINFFFRASYKRIAFEESAEKVPPLAFFG
jgi:hypothetical protein